MDARSITPHAYLALESARLPFAVLSGEEMEVLFVNSAFCLLLGKARDEICGMRLAWLLPNRDGCLNTVKQVHQSGKSETHTESIDSRPHPVYWSYEVWPTWEEGQKRGLSCSVVLQITETGPAHRRAALVNEALLLSAIQQHALMEETTSLNAKLTAEIRERRRAELEIEQLAFYDSLTDLPNRRLLMDRLYRATVACARTLHHGAILFIDLDRIKTVNDTKGHHLGDILLQQTAQRLKRCVREEDTVARLGGDEFVLMLEHLSKSRGEAENHTKAIAIKVLASLNEPYQLEDHEHRGSGSIGITLFGKDREAVSDLLTRADLAQYRAKSAGGGVFRFFDPEMQSMAVSRAVLEADLRRAVQRDQLRLYYQPQVDHQGHVIGYEALLRWMHPERGLLSPAEFIDSAEEHGMIHPIGLWVAEAACKQLMTWNGHQQTSHLTLSINISAREFGHPDYVARMLTIMDEVGADPAKLILELTERLMFPPSGETLPKMLSLKARGLRFALDDFGMGFSSLSSLRSLPVSQLKLDRSFVADILTSETDASIASAVIALGRTLGITVIAEGVETREQEQFLAEHGCSIYQGFLFGRPLPQEELHYSSGEVTPELT